MARPGRGLRCIIMSRENTWYAQGIRAERCSPVRAADETHAKLHLDYITTSALAERGVGAVPCTQSRKFKATHLSNGYYNRAVRMSYESIRTTSG